MLKTLSVLLACYVCVNGVDDRTVELEFPEAEEELVTPSPMLTTPTPPLSKERASCHQNGNDRFLLFVSTMDGQISALNVNADGAMEWSLFTTSKPMLSSTISNVEINNNGVLVRLIPSLKGHLYQSDGENFEPLPINADTMLKSSYKLNDDTTIVGGTDVITYGINLNTGKLEYVCSSEGCRRSQENMTGDPSPIVMVKRNSKTVRAIKKHNFQEMWDFSVSEHTVSYVTDSSSPSIPQLSHVESPAVTHGSEDTHPGENMEYEDPDVKLYACPEDSENSAGHEADDIADGGYGFEMPWLFSDESDDVEFKINVPDGIVMAYSKNDHTKLLWQHKFHIAIESVWQLRDEEMDQLDLFDERYVSALFDDNSGEPHKSGLQTPALYVGTHNQQLYVQQASHVQEELDSLLATQAHLDNDDRDRSRTVVKMPRIAWQPYIATAPSRTPAITEGSNKKSLAWDQGVHSDEIKKEDDNLIGLWIKQYPFDCGYYLFSDSPSGSSNITTNITSSWSWPWTWSGSIVFFVTFSNVGVSIPMIFTLFVILLTLYMMTMTSKKSKSSVVRSCREDSEQTTELPISKKDIILPEQSSTEPLPQKLALPAPPAPDTFNSRYYNEFKEVGCLGKGGYGIVFEVKNNVDHGHYAMKRITLNRKTQARDRVSREVRALATLDHIGIVRYYQAWFECPPLGWQEERDKVNSHHLLSTPTHSPYNIDSQSLPTNTNDESQCNERRRQNSEKITKLEKHTEQNYHPSTFNPLKPFGTDEGHMSFTSEQTNTQQSHAGSTGGFDLLPSDAEVVDSSEDSVSIGPHAFKQKQYLSKWEQDSSIEVIFQSSDCSGSHVPRKFQNVPEDSFSIVFEDSGCHDTDDEISESDSDSCDVSDMSRRAFVPLQCHDRYGGVSLSSTRSDNVSPSNRPKSLALDETSKQTVPSVTGSNPGQAKDYLYIQMQLCKRQSLKDWMNDNRQRDLHRVLDIFDQIVCAVDYVHDKSMMHRDLKPSNIFFSHEGIVKIGDFGLATELDVPCYDNAEGGEGDLRHTAQVGTWLYMSPEQVAGRPYSQAVDIYSLGLIFFELLCPFDTQMERVMSLTDARKHKFPKDFAEKHQLECALITRLLSEDASARPTAADILAHELFAGIEVKRLALHRGRARTISSTSSDNPTLSHSNSESF